jgi:hypothetical protein
MVVRTVLPLVQPKVPGTATTVLLGRVKEAAPPFSLDADNAELYGMVVAVGRTEIVGVTGVTVAATVPVAVV